MDTRMSFWLVVLTVGTVSTGSYSFPNDGVLPACEKPNATSPVTWLTHEKELLGEKGIIFLFSYIGEGLANISGGFRRGGVYEGLLTLGISLDLEKLVNWKGGTFFTSMLYPHGESLTDRYVHDLNRVSNIDAYDSMRLYEGTLKALRGHCESWGRSLL